MIVEEAKSGCGLVVVRRPDLTPGKVIRVKVGRLTPLLAEIKWRNELDTKVARIGCAFLE